MPSARAGNSVRVCRRVCVRPGIGFTVCYVFFSWKIAEGNAGVALPFVFSCLPCLCLRRLHIVTAFVYANACFDFLPCRGVPYLLKCYLCIRQAAPGNLRASSHRSRLHGLCKRQKRQPVCRRDVCQKSKPAVWACETCRFALRNVPFCAPKRAVSGGETARFRGQNGTFCNSTDYQMVTGGRGNGVM